MFRSNFRGSLSNKATSNSESLQHAENAAIDGKHTVSIVAVLIACALAAACVMGLSSCGSSNQANTSTSGQSSSAASSQASSTAQPAQPADTAKYTFGSEQNYKGTLYAGYGYVSQRSQMQMENSTPFFGGSRKFLFVDGKAYWAENIEGTGRFPLHLYSANDDGSNETTLAEEVSSLSPIAYYNGVIYYGTLAVADSRVLGVNASTGESTPIDLDEVLCGCAKGVIGSRSNGDATSAAAPKDIYLYSPETGDYTLLMKDASSYSPVKATDEGVLISGEINSPSLTMVGFDGTVLWNQTYDISIPSSPSWAVAPYVSSKAGYFSDPAKPLLYELDYKTGDIKNHDVSFDGLNPEKSYRIGRVEYVDTTTNSAYIVAFISPVDYSTGSQEDNTAFIKVSLDDGSSSLVQTWFTS